MNEYDQLITTFPLYTPCYISSHSFHIQASMYFVCFIVNRPVIRDLEKAQFVFIVIFVFDIFVFFSSLYKDEDGFLAHEFYIEIPGSRVRKMKAGMMRISQNIRPQVN